MLLCCFLHFICCLSLSCVLHAQCCQCLWIVNSRLSLQFVLMFIYIYYLHQVCYGTLFVFIVFLPNLYREWSSLLVISSIVSCLSWLLLVQRNLSTCMASIFNVQSNKKLPLTDVFSNRNNLPLILIVHLVILMELCAIQFEYLHALWGPVTLVHTTSHIGSYYRDQSHWFLL